MSIQRTGKEQGDESGGRLWEKCVYTVVEGEGKRGEDWGEYLILLGSYH